MGRIILLYPEIHKYFIQETHFSLKNPKLYALKLILKNYLFLARIEYITHVVLINVYRFLKRIICCK